MRRCWILLALGACADPAIDMSLQLPQMPQNFALDCVTAISVTAVGEFQGDINRPPDFQSDCLDVSGMTSFADVQAKMHDQFSIDIPDSGLAGISIVGNVGRCSDEFTSHESVFYGGAQAGSGDVRIPLVPNLSCSARGKIVKVHAVDLLALASTHTCATVTTGRVVAGDIHPTLLEQNQMNFEYGTSASSQWNNGAVSLDVFSQVADARTCVAVGYEQPNFDLVGSRCVEDGLPTLCGPADELELPTIAIEYAGQSIDRDLVAQYGNPVFGAVYEVGTAATKTAIGNATVTLDDPTQGKVVYVDRGATSFTPRAGATGTGTEGWFMVYLKGAPTTITVSEPLHAPVKYKIASHEYGPTTIIAALNKR